MFGKLTFVSSSILALSLLLLIASCGNDDSTGPSNEAVPVLTTSNVSAITDTTAQCGGDITSDGGHAITARGVCWSTNPTPTVADSKTADSTGTGSFASSITGLSANTAYYVRAYATNSAGTGYGSAVQFTTRTASVTDIDGYIYQTVAIGTQVWMAENLKVTHYRNGDVIPNVPSNAAWHGLTSGAYCNYNNDINNVAVYGRMYNWHAVHDSRSMAPEGWHVPSAAEWQTLINYLGGDSTAGGKLKEVGFAHWSSPNFGATNESGFTALPGGWRNSDGVFADMGYWGYFWSFVQHDNQSGIARHLNYNSTVVRIGYNWMVDGASVRCVKD